MLKVLDKAVVALTFTYLIYIYSLGEFSQYLIAGELSDSSTQFSAAALGEP